MNKQTIQYEAFNVNGYDLWENQWLLLTSGDWETKDFNCMTVGWGSIGCMWTRPFAQVLVRPQRYTFEFMEKYPTFTLCAFAPEYRKALAYLGSKSGRDEDKISHIGLTPCAASVVQAPVFEEAELVLECRKTYWQDMDPRGFIDSQINRHYDGDFHRLYWGEIIALYGTEKYSR